MNGYLVPANAKKGTLILNMFRPFDLILFGSGASLTLLLFAFIQPSSAVGILLSFLPGLITGLLVFPIPYYHNVLCAIQSIILFIQEKMKGNYVWRGWCFYEKLEEDKKSRK